MKFVARFTTLITLLGLLTGCAPAATETPTPVLATVTAVPTTFTVLPPTATPVLSRIERLEPTAIPTPEVPRILWDKTYRKTANDMGEDVLVADDGGYYIVGTANLDIYGTGKSGDIYLIRTDENGTVLWEKTYGGEKAEEGLSITRTRDGNLLLAGNTNSAGVGGVDAYLVKVDPQGNEIWSQTYDSSLTGPDLTCHENKWCIFTKSPQDHSIWL